MYASLNEQSYAVQLMYNESTKAPKKISTGCNGCINDPTYEELKKGAICLVKGCRGESKYKARFSVQAKANRKTQGL